MGEEVRHIKVILRGLQMMVFEESLSKYRNEWTLVERVFRMVGRLYRGQELSLLQCQQSRGSCMLRRLVSSPSRMDKWYQREQEDC
jgi:Cys-tRNA synthase (O-phospho-L-seryl-tRNA:Cys-tRNA synthase)